MVSLCTLVFEFGAYVINIAINGLEFETITFFKTLLIEILYNVILTIIIYPLIKKGGYYIQDVYRGSRILTRYF